MRSAIGGVCLYVFGLAVMTLLASQTLVAAIPVETPEMDGSTLVTALGALAAGALILRSRLGK